MAESTGRPRPWPFTQYQEWGLTGPKDAVRGACLNDRVDHCRSDITLQATSQAIVFCLMFLGVKRVREEGGFRR